MYYLEKMKAEQGQKILQKNSAILRRSSLNILKQHSDKRSLKGKRLKAAWKSDYLLSLLSGKVN